MQSSQLRGTANVVSNGGIMVATDWPGYLFFRPSMMLEQTFVKSNCMGKAR